MTRCGRLSCLHERAAHLHYRRGYECSECECVGLLGTWVPQWLLSIAARRLAKR